MNEKQKMLAGELYMSNDPVLTRERNKARKLTRLFNESAEDDLNLRSIIIKELFGKIGNNFSIEPNFRCDYGYNIYIGDSFSANFDCIILDVCEVNIGNNVFFGPHVNIYTATHPTEAEVRNKGLESGKPVTIGNNVWIGGNATILPGVTIGDNTVIGAGSVVTGNVPANVLAAGNPCRIIKLL